MADDISITPGRGAKIAADDVGGKMHQRVKISVGVDGVATDLAFGQQTKANSLPVVLASNDDVHAKLGSVDEAAPSTDTGAAGLNGRLQRIAQNLTSGFGAKVTAVSALGAGGTGIIGWLSAIWDKLNGTLGVNQVSAAYDVKVTVTRPANTTAYSAGDVVSSNTGGAISFAGIGPSGASVMITGAELEIDIATVPAGMNGLHMHLYSSAPGVIADNAAFDLAAGDRAAYLGKIELGTPIKYGSTLYVEADNINKQVKLAGTGIWAYLVTPGAFTPGSGDVLRATLHAQAV